MRILKINTLVYCCLLTLYVCSSSAFACDEEFMDYPATTSEKREKAYLSSFAAYLLTHKEDKGYIIVFVEEKDDSRKTYARAKRARNYLISRLKISENQVFVVFAGKDSRTHITLRPISKDRPPPVYVKVSKRNSRPILQK